MSDALRLGVLVPCRNESAVIGRKLRNLAQLQWPAGEHRLIVVDDGSMDDTAPRARQLLEELFATQGIRAEVVPNTTRPGKAGAIASGLASLEGLVDIVLLSDADVVFREQALEHVVKAFDSESRLGMASGSQEFVASLNADGSPSSAEGGPPTPAAGLYDRITAWVRGLESRGGRLFSIHGQLLAWRAKLQLAATPGVAADDIDLMRQVRLQGFAVRKLDDARFLEVKTPEGPGRRSQEIRRARAYVQAIRLCKLPPGTPGVGVVDRLHFAAYRVLPLAAPWLVLLGVVAFYWVSLLNLPHPAAIGALVLFALASLTPPGRRLIRLLAVIAVATRLEAADSLDDRWEMERTD